MSPEETGVPKRSVWPWIGLGVLIAVLIGLAAWGVLVIFGPKTVEVPGVVGLRVTVARDIVADHALVMESAEVFNAQVSKGLVVSQSPVAGAVVKRGSIVRVAVSKGPRTVSVPGLKGMTRKDAEVKLKAVGLTVGRVIVQFSNKVPDDAVIRQDPQPGVVLFVGEAVDLFVSKGVHAVTVPNVVGLNVTVASRTLGDAGLQAAVAQQPNAVQPAGVVLDQSPAADVRLPINSVVTIIVSSGPPLLKMPDVRRKTQADAVSILDSLGLTVQVNSIADKSTLVIRQSPDPGTMIPTGTTVRIWVGNGQGE